MFQKGLGVEKEVMEIFVLEKTQKQNRNIRKSNKPENLFPFLILRIKSPCLVVPITEGVTVTISGMIVL